MSYWKAKQRGKWRNISLKYHFSGIYANLFIIQEAQLSPRDRVMRRVSWNVANCHATVQKLLVRSPDQIEVIKLDGYGGAMCNKHVHSTIMRWSRFHCPIGVINEPTTDELWISPVYRRLAVAKFSKSTMYNVQIAHVTLTTPLSGKIFHRQGGTCYGMRRLCGAREHSVNTAWIQRGAVVLSDGE